MSWDEAVAEANTASPPDAPLLKIRARAADSILGSASLETAGETSGRRWLLFERLLRFGPRAALAASLVGFAGVAGAYFSGGQSPFFARTPLPASINGPQPGDERVEILHTVQQMADEIGALKARVEAVHAQSPSAKEATALEGLKAGLDAVKTETGAKIAKLADKVDRLQRELTTKSREPIVGSASNLPVNTWLTDGAYLPRAATGTPQASSDAWRKMWLQWT